MPGEFDNFDQEHDDHFEDLLVATAPLVSQKVEQAIFECDCVEAGDVRPVLRH